MFRISIGKYTISVERDKLPVVYSQYREHAQLCEEFDIRNPQATHCFVGLSKLTDWPFLVVGQTFSPSVVGFEPGVLLVPETQTIFIGAGERLLAYNLEPLKRLWEDKCDTGFWGWSQHGEFVLMAAELEFAAWNSSGKKLWTTFVEPPWEYEVIGDQVQLDVMGRLSQFRISEGPAPKKLV